MAMKKLVTLYRWFRWSNAAPWEVVQYHEHNGEFDCMTNFEGKTYPAKEVQKIETIEFGPVIDAPK